MIRNRLWTPRSLFWTAVSASLLVFSVAMAASQKGDALVFGASAFVSLLALLGHYPERKGGK